MHIDGKNVSFTDSGGDGPTIVLVHAFPLDSRMWSRQAEALGDRYRVVTPDLSGCGRSGVPADPSSYSVDGWADEVAGVLDHLDIERAVVGGLSMGGYVTLAFHRRHPERVAGLVLADTRATADTDEARAHRTRQQDQVLSGDVETLKDTLIEALVGPVTKTSRPDVVQQVRALMDQSPAGYIGCLEALKTRPDSNTELTRIGVPTLIVVGEDDALTPPALSREMHEHIAGSELVVIGEAGHLSSLEAPEAFNAALERFLGSL